MRIVAVIVAVSAALTLAGCGLIKTITTNNGPFELPPPPVEQSPDLTAGELHTTTLLSLQMRQEQLTKQIIDLQAVMAHTHHLGLRASLYYQMNQQQAELARVNQALLAMQGE